MGRLQYRDRELLIELQADFLAAQGTDARPVGGDSARKDAAPMRQDLGDYMGTATKNGQPDKD